jgi:hypothetical protein
MISEHETLQTWHWPLPDPARLRPEIIATDADADADDARDRAA